METDYREIFKNFPKDEDLFNVIKNTSHASWDNELTKSDINSWLENFTGDILPIEYEKTLALWLLSHFTFYNKEEVRHLCKIIYKDLIHRILVKSNNTEISIEKIIKEFFKKANIISAEQTSGSGGFIAYFFRQENDLPLELFNFSLENLNESIENIIIIDDVTLSVGSKSQKFEFLDFTTKKFPNKQIYLLTLVASKESIDSLKESFAIEIISAIILDQRDRTFSENSNVFTYFEEFGENRKNEIILIAEKFATHYGKKVDIPGIPPLGYSNGQFLFGFFYNTPDSTLPIFWGQIKSWVPIVKRYHKNYDLGLYLKNEKFL